MLIKFKKTGRALYPMAIIILLAQGIVHESKAQGTPHNDIKGYIRDAKSGEALPFANITVKDTYRGTTSNTDGYFVLVDEPLGPIILKVRYIGYDTKEIQLDNKPERIKRADLYWWQP